MMIMTRIVMIMVMMMTIFMITMANLEQRLYGRLCPDVVKIAPLSHDQLHVNRTPGKLVSPC